MESVSLAENNAAILRRTLSAVGWLYGLWTGLLGAAAWHVRAKVAVDPRLLLLHAALLGLSGALLWKPRRGATIVTLLAAAGSIGFVVFDLRVNGVQAALIDGAYPVLAAVLLHNSRRRA
jgi:hypothetical protein